VSPTLALGLLVLALIDSTSIGTLVIPIWLLLSPRRPPWRQLLVYLAAIAAFYLVAGIVLVVAAQSGLRVARDLVDHPVVLWTQLAAGIALFALCWRFDSARRRRRGESDRTARWRDRVLDGGRSASALIRLALAAGALELLTMLPYLAAIGLLTTSGLPAVTYLPVLAGYCVVMVLPALALAALRGALGDRIAAVLRRIDGYATRHADSAVGWVMGIAGFLLARDAAARLWF
jgi:hypothetical protein